MCQQNVWTCPSKFGPVNRLLTSDFYSPFQIQSKNLSHKIFGDRKSILSRPNVILLCKGMIVNYRILQPFKFLLWKKTWKVLKKTLPTEKWIFNCKTKPVLHGWFDSGKINYQISKSARKISSPRFALSAKSSNFY
jgi:hypothetical protein